MGDMAAKQLSAAGTQEATEMHFRVRHEMPMCTHAALGARRLDGWGMTICPIAAPSGSVIDPNRQPETVQEALQRPLVVVAARLFFSRPISKLRHI
jgi:hypothetical protein